MDSIRASSVRSVSPPAPNTDSPAADRAGRGAVEVERVNGRSVVTRCRARSPLRILTPRNSQGHAAWVFSSTLGGGLVGGDQIDLEIGVGESATCAIATQASTKIFRSLAGRPSRQSLNVSVGPEAMCAVLPDPLTCFAGAAFEQRLRFDLSATSSLVLVDWLTSGRRARGERWAFDRYDSRIDAYVGSKLIFRDAILLDPADGAIDGEHRMGRCDCFGLVLLLGQRVEKAVQELTAWANAQPLGRGDELIFAASPLPGGLVIRVAGPRTEMVGRWIRQRLGFVCKLLGADPWARKW